MTELYDPVPLGRVFLRKDGPSPDERPGVVALIERIEQEFAAGSLAVYARCRAGTPRERLWPADYEIDWFGKAIETDEYCSVCAFRKGLAKWMGAVSRLKLNDAPEDLAINRADWERVLTTGADASETEGASLADRIPSGVRFMTDKRAEEACNEWLAQQKVAPRNKETAFLEAQEQVKGIGALSRKAFDRSWAKSTPDEWRRPGAKRKRSTS